MRPFELLKKHIKRKSLRVCVIGGGYVGLPVAAEFADAGFKTVIYDIDVKKVELINSGESYIEDVPSERLHKLVKSGKLEALGDRSIISTCHALIITVPTPLNEKHEPDLSHVVRAFEDIALYMNPPVIISLESTTYPGTTEEMKAIIENRGYTLGEHFS